MPKLDRKGISLGSSPSWQVSPPHDPQTFVLALPILLPASATLYFEGTSSADVRRFFRRRQAHEPTKVAIGTIWPRPECFHIPATPENVERVAALFARHVPQEICHHFHAYGPQGMILQWYDAFFNEPLYIGKAVPEEMVKEFSKRIGSTYNEQSRA